MEIERIKRYKDEIDLIKERINDTKEWIGNVSMKDFMEDKKLKLATYKAFQEIVEASMDISSMIVRDLNLIIKDDYSNLNMLHENKILPKDVIDALKEANSLRNRLIHGYNNLREDIVFSSINNLMHYFEKFIEGVKKWLKKKI